MPPARTWSISEPAAAWGFLLAPMACATLLLTLPRPVAPELVPALHLPAGEVAAVIAQDVRDAARAPRGARADELRELLVAHGAAEAQGGEAVDTYSARRELLAERAKAFVAAEGERALRALRAQALQKLERALAGGMPIEEARSVIGALPTVLARQSAAHDGTLLVPHFVLRTFYKGHLNVLFGRAPEHDLARVEKLALFGFQALHDERKPIVSRAEALREYARLGGRAAGEALGVLAYRNGDLEQAAQLLSAVAQATGELRLRNYAEAARRQRAQSAER